jgi:hypothetical protein
MQRYISCYRLHNKGVYVKMGLRKMVGRKLCKDLHKEIRLEVDGKLVELPQVEGIIILNILRYAVIVLAGPITKHRQYGWNFRTLSGNKKNPWP